MEYVIVEATDADGANAARTRGAAYAVFAEDREGPHEPGMVPTQSFSRPIRSST